MRSQYEEELTMVRRSLIATLGVAWLLGTAALAAHHAFSAEFDASKPIVLRGTVSKTEWINPHSWIHIDVKEPDGKVVTWAVECGAPNSLLRRGLNKLSIPPGTELAVDGFRAKEFCPHGRLAQSISFFSPPGMDRLYSGVTKRTASTSAIAFFSACATGGKLAS